MKQDYTIAELQAEMTALQQVFDNVTLADPRMGLLDPATLQPLNKVGRHACAGQHRPRYADREGE